MAAYLVIEQQGDGGIDGAVSYIQAVVGERDTHHQEETEHQKHGLEVRCQVHFRLDQLDVDIGVPWRERR